MAGGQRLCPLLHQAVRALGQLGALQPQRGLWGRIALEVRVFAPLSSGRKRSLFDLLCQIAPLQWESKRWTLTH